MTGETQNATMFLKRWQWWLATLFLIALTPLALNGLLNSLDKWGISDWDYYHSYHEVVRRLVIEHKEVPQWNPYICGGTSAIGDPEFPLFTPTFLIELIFGVQLGLRLAVLFATAVGAIGMLWLSKRMGLSVWGGVLAAVIVSFGSVTLLEIVEGHPNVFAVMWIPWVLWAWLAAYRGISKRQLWSLLSGAFLGLMFFQGGIYLLMYMAFAFAFLIAMATRKLDALKVTVIAGLWAIGFAAIKLIPVLLWLQQFQDQAYASSAFTLWHLDEILLGRHLHGLQSANIIPDQGGGWHEYGAYIGWPALLLAILGATQIKQRLPRLLLIAAVLAILISSSGPTLKPLFDAAPFLPRSNVSRVILFAAIPMSLLAGFGLDLLRRFISGSGQKLDWQKKAALLVTIGLVALVTYDLTTMSRALSAQPFVLEPVPPLERQAKDPIEHTIDDFVIRQQIDKETGIDYTRAYAAVQAGFGTQSHCTVLGPKPTVTTKDHTEDDQSLVRINHDKGTAELISWSPTRIETRVLMDEQSEVIINSNHARGWTVNGEPTKDIAGRLMTIQPEGEHHLVFRYRAPGFKAGVIITLATLAGAAWLVYRQTKSK